MKQGGAGAPDRRAAEHAVSAPPQDNVASEADVSEKEKRKGVHDPENTLCDLTNWRHPTAAVYTYSPGGPTGL